MGDTGWSVVFKDCPTCFSEETVVGEFNCNCSLRKPWSGENISLKNSLHMLKPTNTLNTSRKKKKRCAIIKLCKTTRYPKLWGKTVQDTRKLYQILSSEVNCDQFPIIRGWNNCPSNPPSLWLNQDLSPIDSKSILHFF